MTDAGGIIPLGQEHVVGEVQVGSAKVVGIPIVHLDVLPDGSQEVPASLQRHRHRYLDVVIAAGEEERGPGLESVRLHLLEEGHATPPDDGPAVYTGGSDQVTLVPRPEKVGIPKADPVPALIQTMLVGGTLQLEGEMAVRLLSPVNQVRGTGQADALDPPLLGQGQPGIEHAPTAIPMGIRRDTHGPEHVIVPGPRIADEQGVLDPRPIQTVVGYGVGDVVVIGQHQVEEMIAPLVVYHFHVADLAGAKAEPCIHDIDLSGGDLGWPERSR